MSKRTWFNYVQLKVFNYLTATLYINFLSSLYYAHTASLLEPHREVARQMVSSEGRADIALRTVTVEYTTEGILVAAIEPRLDEVSVLVVLVQRLRIIAPLRHRGNIN